MVYALKRAGDRGAQDCQTMLVGTDKCGASGKYLYGRARPSPLLSIITY